MKLNRAMWVVVVFLFAATGLWAQQPSTTSEGSGNSPAASLNVPRLIKFSGTVRDLTGKPLTGPVDIHFAIYKEQADAAPLWQETQTLQLDELGRYAVLLGGTQPEGLPIELFTSAEARWLGVTAGNLPEQPRTLLVSVPYALKAGDAETLGGKPASSYVLAQSQEASNSAAAASSSQTAAGTVKTGAKTMTSGITAALSMTGTQNYIPVFTDNSGSLGNSVMYQDGSNIGIGTTTPSAPLHIRSNATASSYGSVYLDTTSPGGHSWGIGEISGVGILSVRDLTASGAPIRFSIDSGGNLGIGTTTPAAKLDVAGNINSSGTVTAASFSGDGSGLTGVNAATATTAATATNALALGGLLPTAYEQVVNKNAAGGYAGLDGSLRIAKAQAPLTTVYSDAGNTFTAGTQNFTGAAATLPVKAVLSANTPTSCVAKEELLIKTDATAGQQLFVCNGAGNGWNLVGDGVGGGVLSFNARTGAVVPAASDYSFAQVSGTVGGTQLSGTYTNAVAFNNTSNSFAGNGSGLTNVAAATAATASNALALGGLLPTAYEQVVNKNAAGGYAGLDGSLRIAKAQAPLTTVYSDTGNTFTAGTQNFTGAAATLPVKAVVSANTPTSCVANKELLIKTDAAQAGQQLFVCNGTGTGWNLVGDGAGGGVLSFNGRTGAVSPAGGDYAFSQISGMVGTGQLSGTYGVDISGNAYNALLLNGLASSAFQPAGSYATLGANTFTATQTLSSGNLNLPETSGASAGVINLGGHRFIHAYNGNTFVGQEAGNFSTSGDLNTAIGDHALYSNTDGARNTAAGDGALYFNTGGGENTATGSAALVGNTTGWENTATGVNALGSNTTGNDNTASGGAALGDNSDGSYNTASGYRALYLDCYRVSSGCTANYNTALGYYAGVTADGMSGNITGANNTFIGALSGPGTSTNLTNATAIGYQALVSASNALVLGGTGANAANVGIGTATPAYTLDVVGTGKFSGAVTAASFSGDGSGLTNLTAGTANNLNCVGCVGNTQLGINYAGSASQGGPATSALAATTAATATNADQLDGLHASSFATTGANTFTNTQTISSGNLALPQTTSASTGVLQLGGKRFIHGCCSITSSNTFVGPEAGNLTTSGTGNTAHGYTTLFSNTTGVWNTASGAAALFSNTTGNGNAASGYQALYSNTTGSFNTASGVYALMYNTTGSYNTASGHFALQRNCYNVSGNCAANGNTGLGYYAGVTSDYGNANTTGTNNTFIGAWSGPGTSTPLNNATALGYQALVSASNALVLGGTGGYAVNVGIGTETPAYALDVVGNINASGSVTASSFVGALSGTATDLNCTGCVTEAKLAFDPATQAELDAEGTARATADTSEGTLRAAADATLLADVSTRVSKGGDIMLGTLNLPANGLVAGTNQLVLSGGNVGVGTATPGQKLEVAGTVKATGFSGDGSGLTNIQGSQIVNTVNTLQVALLKWYPANQAGAAFAVGTSPTGVAFDGANIWVANEGSNNVTKLRASDGANLGTFAVGSTPTAVAFDGANIWVAWGGNGGPSGNVTKLQASDGANLGTFAVGGYPQGVAFDGANIWVANMFNNNVTKLRASDGTVVGTFAVGSYPQGVAFDGANIWVANYYSNAVTKLRASDGANLGTFAVGTYPYGVAFDGANIWVANSASGTASKL